MKQNHYGSATHKDNLDKYIKRKNDMEYKASWDISHIDRENLIDAWKEGQRVGSPFNVMIQCEFTYDELDRDNDIEMVRSLSHHYRVFMGKTKTPTFLMWSRIAPENSGVELITMLVYVKPTDFDKFEKLAEKWDDRNCTVRQVTYDKDIEYAGTMVSSIDILLMACSNETKRKVPNVLCCASDEITRPRTFSSVKLEKQRLIYSWQKRRAALKAAKIQERLPSIEDVVAKILKSKGL